MDTENNKHFGSKMEAPEDAAKEVAGSEVLQGGFVDYMKKMADNTQNVASNSQIVFDVGARLSYVLVLAVVAAAFIARTC